MPEELDLSVVLPAYLEEENLRLLIPRLKETILKLSMRAEIIVVDTTAPLDATCDVCREQGVRHVRRSPGNSFGDAIRTGLSEARGKVIVLMDADGSHPPELVPELVRETASCDVAIASRYIQGGYSENSLALMVMSRVLNMSYSLVLGLKVKDVSNSFRAYRRDVVKDVNLRCENFDVVEELLYKIKRRHAEVRIVEVPFTFKKRMFGRTKRNLLLFMATYLITILKLRFRSS